MNDRLKIYKRAFYNKDPKFEKETDEIITKMNAFKKQRLKERKALNKADGTVLYSSFSNQLQIGLESDSDDSNDKGGDLDLQK